MDAQASPVEVSLLRLLSLLSRGATESSHFESAVLEVLHVSICTSASHSKKVIIKGSGYKSEQRSTEACMCVHRPICSFAGSFS